MGVQTATDPTHAANPARAATRYRAFGDLVVQTSAGEHVLSRRRERDTLAVLLAQRAPVSADRLLAEVWDSEAALGSLQAVVSRLRSTLEPGRSARGENRCLVSSSAGYAVRADTEDVDTWQFEHLASGAVAEPDPATALARHREAERLWTGPPYADCETESVAAVRARLVELRAASTERAGQALLDLGRPEEAVLLLGGATADHPFRERLHALLALGQYRCGRQSEALTTLRELRTRLADELGVDPTPDVRRLEDDLLQQSPRLDGPVRTPEPVAEPSPVVPAAPDEPARATAGPPDLLGREGPLDHVTTLLDRLPDGPTRVVTVLGEPGIGKTRFAAEVLRRAAERGMTGVTGQCHEGDVAPALWPWTQVVRSLVEDPAAADPLLAPLLGAAEPTHSAAGTIGLFEAVGRLLTDTAARRGGLVVVLEDLHWADTTSLQLLGHLVEDADPTARSGVLLLVTRRSTEEHGSPQMVPTLGLLARAGAERIRLDGLSRADVGRLLTQLLGDVPDAVVDVVDEATAGNAFFVREYARLLETLEDLPRLDSLPVPDGVRDVIGQRVQRLPDAGRHLLTAAAVLGRVIDPADAAALAEQDLDEALDHLDLALATGLLEERAERYAFAHALTRETLYAGLSAARRVRLHARAADVLAARLGDAPDAAADIAHHALLAVPLGPDRARTAFTRLARAAQVALARQAPVESRELWSRARAIAEDLGLEDERLHAMLGEAQSAVRMGTFTEAPALVKQLAQEAQRLGHWDLVAGAARTFHGSGAWTWRHHGAKDEELIEVFTAALDHVEGADEATLCATLAIEHQFGWDTERSEHHAQRAVAVAREVGDHDLLCSALLTRLLASTGRPDLGARSRLAQELLDEHPGDAVEVTGLFHLAYALHEEGRVEEAERVIELTRERAGRLAHSGLEVPLAWWAAAVARDHDDPDVEQIAGHALSLHLGQRFYHGTELQTLHAVLHREPGKRVDDEVIRTAREGLHAQRALVAWSLVEDGHPDLAAEVIGEMPPAHAADYAIPASLCFRIVVAAALDRRDDVAELLRRIDRFTIPLAVNGSVQHLGAFDHFRAVGHRALGDPVRALELARAAVETNRRCDIRPWLRRSEQLVAELEAELGLPPGGDPEG